MTCFDVTRFGAAGDAETLDTAAIQAAVDACADAGGGRVLVPAGVFRSGPIFLRSNVEFHLSIGATLRGSREMTDYPRLDVAAHGYHIDHWHASLLTGCNLENVAITGRGRLEGEGDVWWLARDEKRLQYNRPVIVYLFNCEHVQITDITAERSPSWTLLSVLCRDLTIDKVTVKNPWLPYCNCDGINLHACNNVRITGCYVDTGDDGICLKSLPEWYVGCHDETDYARPHIPCENVLIANCVVEHAHGGVTLGAEVIGGIRNVTVSNCIFHGTRAGIRIYRYPWPGGYVENIRVDSIIMRQVAWMIFVESYFDPERMQAGPEPETTPAYRNIHFSNITATQAQVACEARGLPQMPIGDLSFRNIRVEADMGFALQHVAGTVFDDVEVSCRGVPLTVRDAADLTVRRFNPSTPPVAAAAIELTRVNDAWITDCTAAGPGILVGVVGSENRHLLVEGNRLRGASAQAPVAPANQWNVCTHAYSGARWIRDSGDRNPWLPVTAAVMATIRRTWEAAAIDRIFSVSRVEPNARNGAEVDDPAEQRRIYLIEAREVVERLVIFEDGELLRRVADPAFHAHTWTGM